ncbi:uncharacterized protein G2W53_008509 [Senna tora]|uniref:Uncharacterized protein n=1 Tax=Senna tora TaxID=362788 RepID=A0A834X8T0_9FABA|nr:uncharacterized protein G2W53_008509 [Senna tora]
MATRECAAEMPQSATFPVSSDYAAAAVHSGDFDGG